MARMIGNSCAFGPGGSSCPCCNDYPLKGRKMSRRRQKRRERQAAVRDIQDSL